MHFKSALALIMCVCRVCVLMYKCVCLCAVLYICACVGVLMRTHTCICEGAGVPHFPRQVLGVVNFIPSTGNVPFRFFSPG